MQRITYSLIFFLFQITVSAQVTNYILYSPIDHDVRSTALGQTSIISANSGSAIFSNPSLISYSEGKQISFGIYYLDTGEGGGTWHRSDGYTQYNSTLKPYQQLSDIAFVYPNIYSNSDFQLSIGIGYKTHFDYRAAYALNGMGLQYNEQGMEDTESFTYNGDSRGLLYVFSQTGSISLKSGISLGATINWGFGTETKVSSSNWTSSVWGADSNDWNLKLDHRTAFFTFGATQRVRQFIFAVVYTPFHKIRRELKGLIWIKNGENNSHNAIFRERPKEINSKLKFGAECQLSSNTFLYSSFSWRYLSDMTFHSYHFGVEINTIFLPIRAGIYKKYLVGDTHFQAITFGTGFKPVKKITINVAYEYKKLVEHPAKMKYSTAYLSAGIDF